MAKYTIYKDERSYTVEVTAKSPKRIIDTINRQVTQALEGEDISEETRRHLYLTKKAIEDNVINADTLDSYFQLWTPTPMFDGDSEEHSTVILTIFRDSAQAFLCFIPYDTIYYNVSIANKG